MTARGKRGTWRVILKSGAEFTYRGILRREWNEDGYICEIEMESADLPLHPGMSDVAAILQVDR